MAAQFPGAFSLSPVAGLPLALMGFWTIDRAVRHTQRRPRVRGVTPEERVGAILDDIPACEVLPGARVAGATLQRSGISHLVLRGDGAMFLVATRTHWRVPRQKRLEGIVTETLAGVADLTRNLKSEFNIDMAVNAAVVFPNAHVKVARRLRGVEVLGAESLHQWIASSEHPDGDGQACVNLDEVLRRLGAR